MAVLPEQIEGSGIEFLNAEQDPAKANMLAQQFMQAATEPVDIKRPPAPAPAECFVELPGGFLDPATGEFVSQAEVRELNGDDEEAMSKAETAGPAQVFNVALERGVVSVGGRKADRGLLDGMLIGDREMLLLAISRATYGDELELDTTCPYCSHEVTIGYSLTNDVPVKRLDTPPARYEVPLRRGVAEVKLPIGLDQNALADARRQKATVAQMNTILVSRVLVSLNGQPVLDGLMAAKQMGIADRNAILEAILEIQPGPRYSDVKQECPSCRKEYPLQIDVALLFRR